MVAVTRGALERLTRAELQGVVAHEFSHLVHGDTRLNMRLIGLVWGLQMIWGLGAVAVGAQTSDGRRGLGALFGLGLMAVGSLGWAAGRLLQAAVSRQREFLADASAVKYTRVVDGLGGALRKIADQQLQGRADLKSPHAASLAHLMLAQRRRARRLARAVAHPPAAGRAAAAPVRPRACCRCAPRCSQSTASRTPSRCWRMAPVQPATGVVGAAKRRGVGHGCARNGALDRQPRGASARPAAGAGLVRRARARAGGAGAHRALAWPGRMAGRDAGVGARPCRTRGT